VAPGRLLRFHARDVDVPRSQRAFGEALAGRERDPQGWRAALAPGDTAAPGSADRRAALPRGDERDPHRGLHGTQRRARAVRPEPELPLRSRPKPRRGGNRGAGAGAAIRRHCDRDGPRPERTGDPRQRPASRIAGGDGGALGSQAGMDGRGAAGAGGDPGRELRTRRAGAGAPAGRELPGGCAAPRVRHARTVLAGGGAMIEAFVGLGSNLGDRLANLANAVALLSREPGFSLRRVSLAYESEPIGPPQPRYLNAVAQIGTLLSPRATLQRLQAMEERMGRIRRERWGS